MDSKSRLVPVEPTKEMLDVAQYGVPRCSLACGIGMDQFSGIWNGMLAASPFSLLNLQPGTVVVWRTDAVPTMEQAEALMEHLPDGVRLIALELNASLEELDEESMRRAGWVRASPATSEQATPTDLPVLASHLRAVVDFVESDIRETPLPQPAVAELPSHEAEYDEVVLLKCPRQDCGKDVVVSWHQLESGTAHECACGYRWRIADATLST